jgi:hypothetical protein
MRPTPVFMGGGNRLAVDPLMASIDVSNVNFTSERIGSPTGWLGFGLAVPPVFLSGTVSIVGRWW